MTTGLTIETNARCFYTPLALKYGTQKADRRVGTFKMTLIHFQIVYINDVTNADVINEVCIKG